MGPKKAKAKAKEEVKVEESGECGCRSFVFYLEINGWLNCFQSMTRWIWKC